MRSADVAGRVREPAAAGSMRRGGERAGGRRPRGRAHPARSPRCCASTRPADLLVVTSPVNLRYLTGFTGTNGLALIAAARERAEALPHRLPLRQRSPPRRCPSCSSARSPGRPAGGARRGALPASKSPPTGRAPRSRSRLAPTSPSCSPRRPARLRGGRDDRQAARAPARAAGASSGSSSPAAASWRGCARSRSPPSWPASAPPPSSPTQALREVLEAGLAGRSEREVAIDLELRMRRLGAAVPELPLDRRRRPARRAAPRRAPRGADPARHARHDRLGRAAGGLLLGLHPHLRHRRAPPRGGPRGVRARAARPSSPASPPCARAPTAERSTRSPAR